MCGRTQGLNFDIVIYREVLKKSSSQEPQSQFQPNLISTLQALSIVLS